MKQFFHHILIAAGILMAAPSIFAAGDGLTVSGVVLDGKKEPVIGAMVILQGSTTVHAIILLQ